MSTSLVSLTVQVAGSGLVAILTLLLARSVRRSYCWYWALGWLSLATALGLMLVSLGVPSFRPVLLPLALFGEYAFGFFVVAGCASYASGTRLERHHGWWFIPGVVLATTLAWLASLDLELLLVFHAPVLAALFAVAWRVLRPARRAYRDRMGVMVASTALVALAIDFLHYAPLLVLLHLGGAQNAAYLRYHWLYDLILETLLAFGVIMMVLEALAADLEQSNRALAAARDRLEVQARIDPLTEVFNRHAFHSFLETDEPTRPADGCAVVVDVDNLKRVNDALGHAAGDAAIRGAAKAIRSVIRPDDMLFRWGGDEFLVLLFGIDEAEARQRMQALGRASGPVEGAGMLPPLSWGVARFDAHRSVSAAIERADDDMYAHRKQRRSDAVSRLA